MTKTQLAENIIKSIEKNEWQQLQEGTLPVPVSEHNRTVLLELHQAGVDYTGEDGWSDLQLLCGEEAGDLIIV